MNRKQETIHREQCCYWSLDSVHTRRLKPHSEWEVCHAILWETHTLISVCWLTNSRRPVRHLNYYGAQTWVSKGETEIRNGTCFFPQPCNWRWSRLGKNSVSFWGLSILDLQQMSFRGLLCMKLLPLRVLYILIDWYDCLIRLEAGLRGNETYFPPRGELLDGGAFCWVGWHYIAIPWPRSH